jgi:uncharacterized protein YqjF (DUF2071 family)
MNRSSVVSRILLVGLLATAGVLHLLRPELFDPAIPFSAKLACNIFAGSLELVLAAGLMAARTRDHAARLSALWFLLLTPVHLYVSWYAIPVFGVSAPGLLWGRTLLQPVLFFWALSLQERGWLMAQRWRDVAFLHYEVSPAELQKKVPFPLDLYEGKAIVSIVPFRMEGIRFPFFPPLPGLSRLLELNLRTYVKVAGRPGIYFFTLDANHLTGVLVARWFFALPYRWIKLTFSSAPDYAFTAPTLRLSGEVGPPRASTAFDLWATERYALFTKRGTTTLLGEVLHEPWPLQDFTVGHLEETFSSLIGKEFAMKQLLATAYSGSLDVRFRPFRKI